MFPIIQAPRIKVNGILFPSLFILAILVFCQIVVTHSVCPRICLVQVLLSNATILINAETIESPHDKNIKESTGFQSQENFNFKKGIILQGNETNRILNTSNLDEIIDKEGLEVHRWLEDPECAGFSIRFAKKKKIRARALVSFPGSGNYWVRHLIESSTGIFTGDLRTNSWAPPEFPGNARKANDGTTIVQKTHHGTGSQVRTSPEYVGAKVKKSEALFGYRGILIIRNPFDAILAQWNFRVTFNHTGHVAEDSFTKKQKILTDGINFYTYWNQFVETATKQWAELIETWITKSPDLHVVLYEELKRNFEGELLGILQYLKHAIDSRRIKCTLRHNEGSFHRKHGGINKIKIYRNMVNTSKNSTLEQIVLNNIKKVELFLMERGYPLQLDYKLQQ